MPPARRPDPILLAQFRQRILESLAKEQGASSDQASPMQAQMLELLGKIIGEARRSGLASRIDRIWLFGSCAWGQPDDYSDVDLLIDSPKTDELAWQISRVCGRPVHAVFIAEASLSLRERVLRHGRPL